MKLILTSIKHERKSPVYYLLTKRLGLLSSTGTKWQTCGKILTPALHCNIRKGFIQTFNEKTESTEVKELCNNTLD
ncbi:hypothetical protein GEV33_001159 [Tenebrio molitor]|uniref:Uncharacterized protein n=1 Tax=Tenebrio molitor TaxID=7067 RepID=A0A8J6LK64_TENMO|nr:hypothetical protein GEV33_001159 [Tenebrio molitor]